MWPDFRKEMSLPASLATTIYYFGFSEQTGLIHSYAYRSASDFRSERIPYGLGVKPECRPPDSYQLPKDIRKMMDDQRAIQALLPKEQRVFIGGDIQIHHLSKEGCYVYTLDRFEDYDSDEKAIYENFRDV